MLKLHEKYIVDENGKKTAVMIGMDKFKKIMKIVEDYEDIKDFDERMKNPTWITSEDFLKKTK